MQDDDIFQRIQSETVYLPDDGFSQKVMLSLPQPRRYRQRVIGISWALALLLGLYLWGSGGRILTLFSLEPAVLLSAATLGFWAILGLFVFVAKDEGILDV
ncbi:MAG TPA: hypothetical protein VFO10_08150 [Oligoflexus sp.]|uniref:hypothetical protein n=1 Tax=Oligoflexus sp. TaxID=1971216 RepID=UPI002D7E588D|nr:hypothetical protein [Oligoflexus sp.]HET9237208.1 hypothetical protein [Oligoflexus sp.]